MLTCSCQTQLLALKEFVSVDSSGSSLRAAALGLIQPNPERGSGVPGLFPGCSVTWCPHQPPPRAGLRRREKSLPPALLNPRAPPNGTSAGSLHCFLVSSLERKARGRLPPFVPGAWRGPASQADDTLCGRFRMEGIPRGRLAPNAPGTAAGGIRCFWLPPWRGEAAFGRE